MKPRAQTSPYALPGSALRLLIALQILAGLVLEAHAETKLDFWHSYQPPGGPIHYSFHVANYKRGIFFGSCGPSTRSLQWEYDIDLSGPGPTYQKEQVLITSAGKKTEVAAGTIVLGANQRETTISLKVQSPSGVSDFLANGTYTVRKLK